MGTEQAAVKRSGGSAINAFFLFFIVSSILLAASNGKMQAISDASFQAAKGSVTLAISLIGMMALWLGLVRVLEAGGLMFSLGRALRPLLARLFPEVPADHPAMGAMVLNISANMLGLGNAATPFGIKAMIELNRLNPLPGVATDAMCLFVAIVTSSVTLFPLGVINVRAAAGSADPAAIFLPTLMATIVSTLCGIVSAVLLARRDRRYREEISQRAAPSPQQVRDKEDQSKLPSAADYDHLRFAPDRSWKLMAEFALLIFFVAAIARIATSDSPLRYLRDEVLSFWLMPGLMLAIACYGMASGVKVYEAVTEGAKQGFETAIRIIPFLVAMLVAIAMFRASGAMELLVTVFSPITTLIGMPADTLPMAIARPLSGSGSFGIMSSLVEAAPNSYSAYVASTMQGASDTTFYIIAVYFGAAGVVRVRHAIVAGLIADISGTVASCLWCSVFWTGSSGT